MVLKERVLTPSERIPFIGWGSQVCTPPGQSPSSALCGFSGWDCFLVLLVRATFAPMLLASVSWAAIIGYLMGTITAPYTYADLCSFPPGGAWAATFSIVSEMLVDLGPRMAAFQAPALMPCSLCFYNPLDIKIENPRVGYLWRRAMVLDAYDYKSILYENSLVKPSFAS